MRPNIFFTLPTRSNAVVPSPEHSQPRMASMEPRPTSPNALPLHRIPTDTKGSHWQEEIKDVRPESGFGARWRNNRITRKLLNWGVELRGTYYHYLLV